MPDPREVCDHFDPQEMESFRCVHCGHTMRDHVAKQSRSLSHLPNDFADPLKRKRLLLSFRRPGRVWSITEDGAGESVSLSNSARAVELSGLTDEDLDEIIELCTAMQNERKKDHA